MAAVNWTVETDRTKCMNQKQSGCSASRLSPSFRFVLLHSCVTSLQNSTNNSLILFVSHVFSPRQLLGSDACQVAASLDGGQVRREEPGGGRGGRGGRGGGTWRRVEWRRRGRRPDASDKVRGGGGGGGGVRVDPSKSLGSFSRLKLLPACEEQGLCQGASHPGERLASGRFSEESNAGEK